MLPRDIRRLDPSDSSYSDDRRVASVSSRRRFGKGDRDVVRMLCGATSITRRDPIPALAVLPVLEINVLVLGGNDGLQLVELEADDCGMLAIGFETFRLGTAVDRFDE